jgi:hypothetical protein
MQRFGLCEPVNWQHIFKSPEFYLENLRDDANRIVFQVFYASDLRAKLVKLKK